METDKTCILVINGGSSSIKFAIYQCLDTKLNSLLEGEIENIGHENTQLNFTKKGSIKETINAQVPDNSKAAIFLIEWLKKQDNFELIKAIGHRVVHGMNHIEPEKITHQLLDELKQISSYDPEHLPGEINLIEVFQKHCKGIVQIACFDTSFHAHIPQCAKLLPIPRKYFDKGIRRYGFHGISYQFLIQELTIIAGKDAANSNIILAHLGSGASMAAVKDGTSIDTTMGFTPAGGLPMSTRSGNLDPGVAWYLMQSENLNADAFSVLVNHQSGLLGLSETSSDMRQLLKIENTDNRAAETIEFFCYEAKKYIGAYTAALEGLDIIVFAGGIGEHAPQIRERICSGLQFLGIELDTVKNNNNEQIISAKNSKVVVYVIKTNEQLMIAQSVLNILNIPTNNN